MTSYILSSVDKNKRDAYIAEFCDKHGIDKFDVSRTGIEQSKNTGSIGIEDIKSLQKNIFLKPIHSENKVIVIDDAQLLTVEAQNSLLKLLEEPPDRTIIFLSTETYEPLLSTILSRCQVIKLEEDFKTLGENDNDDMKQFINNLPEMKIGERLKIAEELAKDKEKAITRIANVIIFLHEQMTVGEIDNSVIEKIKSFQKLHTLLKTTNVNPRMAIENILLSLT